MAGPYTSLPCVHCGLCLDACPTYRMLGTEGDSPRGRIYLMEAINRGVGTLDEGARAHLDGCLGCMGCESACPSGVNFSGRIEAFTTRLAPGPLGALWRRIGAWTSQNRTVIDQTTRLARLADSLGLGPLRRRLPAFGLLPETPAKDHGAQDPGATERRTAAGARLRTTSSRLAETNGRSAGFEGARPLRVALLKGCAAHGLRPEIDQAATEVLARNGFELVSVPEQGCCGALALHGGRREEALGLARANVAAFAESGAERVVATAAGCGAQLKDYGRILADDTRLGQAASRVAAMARDICELLIDEGLHSPARRLDTGGDVAYHDPCHLLHVQGVAQAPRSVIQAATGRQPVDLGDNRICCGSAGSYNLEHPCVALELGRTKALHAAGRDLALLATGNIGCMLQLERALRLQGNPLPVRHPVELLAQAYRLEGDAAAGADRLAAAKV